MALSDWLSESAGTVLEVTVFGFLGHMETSENKCLSQTLPLNLILSIWKYTCVTVVEEIYYGNLNWQQSK